MTDKSNCDPASVGNDTLSAMCDAMGCAFNAEPRRYPETPQSEVVYAPAGESGADYPDIGQMR